MTFGNFAAATGNEQAQTSAAQFVQGEVRDLYLFGDPGVGKTHLLAGAYNMAMISYCPKRIRFANIARLLKIARDDFQTREEAEGELIDDLLRMDLLFLDDLCAEVATGRTREFIYLLLDGIIETGKPRLFMTGNKGIRWISENISDRIGSRMSGIFGVSGVFRVSGDDRRLS